MKTTQYVLTRIVHGAQTSPWIWPVRRPFASFVCQKRSPVPRLPQGCPWPYGGQWHQRWSWKDNRRPCDRNMIVSNVVKNGCRTNTLFRGNRQRTSRLFCRDVHSAQLAISQPSQVLSLSFGYVKKSWNPASVIVSYRKSITLLVFRMETNFSNAIPMRAFVSSGKNEPQNSR